MGVFLCFGDAQLGLALLRHVFAKAIGKLFGRVGAGSFDVRRILGQHHEVGQFGVLLALESVEVLLHKGAGHFPGTVGTEIHEQHRVTIVDRSLGLARSVDPGWRYKLVVFPALISLFQPGYRIGRSELRGALGHQVVGRFHAVPAVVAIHGIVAAHDRGNAADAEALQFGRGLLQGWFCAAGRHVTAIEEGVDVNFLRATCGGKFGSGNNVVFVAVYTTGRHQTHEMNGSAALDSLVDR